MYDILDLGQNPSNRLANFLKSNNILIGVDVALAIDAADGKIKYPLVFPSLQ